MTEGFRLLMVPLEVFNVDDCMKLQIEGKAQLLGGDSDVASDLEGTN
jgi:hypothetical protein